MRTKFIITLACLSAILMGVIGLGVASAAPSNAPNSFTAEFTCDNNQTVTIVTNGQGQWTAGHLVSINGQDAKATYIPLAFTGTFIPDQSIDGQTSFQVFNEMKNGNRNGVTNTLTCSASQPVLANDPENPYGVDGNLVLTVTAFEAGNSH